MGISEIGQRLERLEGKLDRMAEDVSSLKATVKLMPVAGTTMACQSHESRLSGLETKTENLSRRMTQLFAGLAVLLFVINLVIPYIHKLLIK